MCCCKCNKIELLESQLKHYHTVLENTINAYQEEIRRKDAIIKDLIEQQLQK